MINLKGLLTGGLAKVADSAKGIIEAVTAGKLGKQEAADEMIKEFNRHAETIIAQANELEKAYLVDVADSRMANVKLQESAESSWLAKNAAYIFDFIIIIAFIAMLVMIVYKTVPENNKELFYMGFGLLGAQVGQVIGFHRGSSQGSKDNGRRLEQMIHRKPA